MSLRQKYSCRARCSFVTMMGSPKSDWFSFQWCAFSLGEFLHNESRTMEWSDQTVSIMEDLIAKGIWYVEIRLWSTLAYNWCRLEKCEKSNFDGSLHMSAKSCWKISLAILMLPLLGQTNCALRGLVLSRHKSKTVFGSLPKIAMPSTKALGKSYSVHCGILGNDFEVH